MGFSSARPVSDGEYLLSRARAEAEMADHAASGRPADVHHELASAYLGRLFNDGTQGGTGQDLITVQREKRLALQAIFTSPLTDFGAPVTGAGSDPLMDLLDKLE